MFALWNHLLLCLLACAGATAASSVFILTNLKPLELLMSFAPELTMESTPWYLLAFLFLAIWRYLRLVVHIVSAYTYQPIMPKQNPTFTSQDCTVVMATFDGKSPVFDRCIDSILANKPFRLLIVTPIQNLARLQRQFAYNSKVLVLGPQRGNKRLQQVCGLRHVDTAITVFADDDVIWAPEFLHCSLAVFEDSKVGAGGTRQRSVRDSSPNIWEFFGAVYLERRNFECSASAHIEGKVSTLSGRTQLVRTVVIKNEEFMRAYLSEVWLNWIVLSNADDDKFVTRWISNHGWKMAYQICDEALLTTTLQPTCLMYLSQCVRWHRTIWRSAVTAMFVERKVWKKQPWAIYAYFLKTFNPVAIIMDPTLAYLLYKAVNGHNPAWTFIALVLFCLWLVFTKTVKLIGHLWRNPSDIKFLPAHYAFGYFHGFIKLYTLFTLHKTQWAGRLIHDDEATDESKHSQTFAVIHEHIHEEVATPGVVRLAEGGQYEFPRIVKADPGRPRLPRSCSATLLRSLGGQDR